MNSAQESLLFLPFEHKIIKIIIIIIHIFKPPCNVLFIIQTYGALDDFLKTSGHFLKIFQNCWRPDERSEHFLKISEDFGGRTENGLILNQRVQFKRQTWCQWNNRYLH